MKNKTICLNMIVKDEKHIIQRCFDSLKDYIDYWVISDTGSTDGTQDFIRSYFEKENIPGELFEDPWKDFSHNRNLALEHAAEKSDYILIMDADDYFEGINQEAFSKLTHDSYNLKMKRGVKAIEYYNVKIIKADLPWYWEGVLHEVLCCDTKYSNTNLINDELIIASTTEGARAQDPNKYKKDAEILERGLLEEPENSRYQFYLARSYYDHKDYEKAIKAFEKRVSMGGWSEEVYYSLLQIANCKEFLNASTAETIESFLRAHKYRPTRLEALYEALRICRMEGLSNLGYELGKKIKKIRKPDDILFVDKSVYDWKFLDECSICAINAGAPEKARGIIARLLKSSKTPLEERQRLEKNLKVANRS